MALTNERRTPMSDLSIVLDLDDTLIQCLTCGERDRIQLREVKKLGIYSDPNLMDLRVRSHRLRMYDACADRGSGEEFAAWVIERPHLKEFLIFAFQYFKTVNVWTAGTRAYGEEIARTISKGIGTFDHIFTRDDCEEINDYCYKPLDKLIKHHPDVGPICKVFALDDQEDSYHYNQNNGIKIPKYNPTISVDSLRTNDDHLLRLKYLLSQDEVIHSEDVRKLNKKSVFSFTVEDYRKRMTK